MLHASLSKERWARFSRRDQLLMIGTELKRFQHWAARHDEDAAAHAADRALELLDLTIATAPPGAERRELCRAREVARGALQSPAPAVALRTLTRTLIGDL